MGIPFLIPSMNACKINLSSYFYLLKKKKELFLSKKLLSAVSQKKVKNRTRNKFSQTFHFYRTKRITKAFSNIISI